METVHALLHINMEPDNKTSHAWRNLLLGVTFCGLHVNFAGEMA